MTEPLLSLPLIGARVIHFASTVTVAGVVLFLFFVEGPALRKECRRAWPALASFHSQLLIIAWLSLAMSILSGAAWLLFLSAGITGSSVAQVIVDGTAQTVLTRTQFGHDSEARLVLALLLAVAFLRLRRTLGWRLAEGSSAAALAVGFLGTLAWSGHGGATPGLRGDVHVTADALHLIAAGAWIGGLLPLRLLLSSAAKGPGAIGVSIARDATLRFSTLGMVAVATLILTGFVNAWILVGGVSALVEFQYGRLLLLKIGIFLVLLVVAAINRTRLTPRLAKAAVDWSHPSTDALRGLKRNCLVEAVLGLTILIIVGVLGTISPGMDMQG